MMQEVNSMIHDPSWTLIVYVTINYSRPTTFPSLTHFHSIPEKHISNTFIDQYLSK